jgi:hypothetical protein
VIKLTNLTSKKREYLPKVKEPPPLPSIAELIAEARDLGEDDLADSFEKLRYLDSPKGQKVLDQYERRLSRL